MDDELDFIVDWTGCLDLEDLQGLGWSDGYDCWVCVSVHGIGDGGTLFLVPTRVLFSTSLVGLIVEQDLCPK